MSCCDPTDDACAVARHAKHVEGRGGSVCVLPGGTKASDNLQLYSLLNTQIRPWEVSVPGFLARDLLTALLASLVSSP